MKEIEEENGMMNIDKIIQEMKTEDKISYGTGADSWHTKEMREYGIPAIMMSDGPHGLRCQKGGSELVGINKSLPATCFPTAVSAANTWNRELIKEEGKAIAEEAREMGVSIVLGPGCNIKRNPLGGRNFEYYSEDPCLAGEMAASFIQAAEEEGIGTSLKHFACNSQEYKRQNGNSLVDERTLHEIYLKPFEIAVKKGKPSTVMCSYNRINGVYSSDNKQLLTDILRKDWGFDGLVMTDWGAMSDRIKAYQAGCDLSMPGPNTYMEKDVLEALKKGDLSMDDVDRSVGRILRLVDKGNSNLKEYIFDRKAHHALAKRIALEGAVLLKNEGMLPLIDDDFCLLGYMAEDIRYQGSGSSHINPLELHQLNELMKDVAYAACTDKQGKLTDLESGLELAKKHSKVVIAAGLPDSYESEGFDREHMHMSDGYNRLIEEICKVNENVAVVLFGGSAMELPWADHVKAILYMGLPGQAGAEAVKDLLTGKANPSGKLAETWPMTYEDVISKDTFGQRCTEYREGIYVGYRYYDKASLPVRYPFGYGLSFTTFEYSDLKIKDGKVSCTVVNTGEVAGKETVQLYVARKDESYDPIRTLKDFAKVELQPNESKTVSFDMDDSWFEVYQNGFKKAEGDYTIEIAADSRDIRCRQQIHTEGEKIEWKHLQDTWYVDMKNTLKRTDWEKLMGHKVEVEKDAVKGHFTMDNSCLEMKKSSPVMKILYMITRSTIGKTFKPEERTMDDPAYRMMITSATDCPMRAVVTSSGGLMSENLARGLVDMTNGHYLKGLRKVFKK